MLERRQLGGQFHEGGLVVVEKQIEDLVGQQIGRTRQGVPFLLDSFGDEADAAQGLVVESDQKVAADEKVEFGGLEHVAAVDVVHRVDDGENVVFVVVDLGSFGHPDAVLDRQRMEAEDAFEHGFVFLRGGVFHVHPDLDVGVVQDDAQEIQRPILVDQLALAENKGANHGSHPVEPRRSGREIRGA